ncbi:MAG: HAD family hydrolase [Acidimicrobiales bacterium]
MVFDWYNTLGAPSPTDFWMRLPELILAAGGTPDAAAFSNWDTGHPTEHVAHSVSERAYRQWQRRRFEDLLDACCVSEPARTNLAEEVETIRYSRVFEVFDDVADTLEGLRDRGLSVGICSNWDWDLDRHLRHNAIADRVDFVVCSAVHGYRKPHQAVFDAVMDHVGVPPGRVLFAGDNWNDDIIGAISAGLRPVHVNRNGPCDQVNHGEVPCLPDTFSLLSLLR